MAERRRVPHEQRLERLWELASLLATERDTARLVELVLDQAIQLVAAERGFVVLASSGDVAAARNLDREQVLHPEFKYSRSIVASVVKTGTPILVGDATTDERTRDAESVQAMNLRSIVCVPLQAHGRILGAVFVDHRFSSGSFDESDLRTLRVFAVPAAIALDAAERTRALEQSREELEKRVRTIEGLRAELAQRYRDRSREASRLRSVVAERAAALDPESGVPGVVARSGALRRVVELAKKVAPSPASVLILGESGTGKEVLARAIHGLSPRRERPFVAENCAAMPEQLLASELFGHVAGAFTGATATHRGIFETAAGGTVFLDEIGDTSPGFQASLLRVLQEREIRPLGGEERIAVDVRVIAATNRDLEALIARGEFRADLYYRLGVVRIDVPPLRDRPEDVLALTEHFLAGLGARIDEQAREILVAHDWPGNARELENELARAAILAGPGGTIRPPHLSPAVLGGLAPAAQPPGDDAADEEAIRGVWPLDALEKAMVQRALRRARGNKTVAARLLGIAKTSLYNRIEKHGLAADG